MNIVTSWTTLSLAKKIGKPTVFKVVLDKNAPYFTPYNDSLNLNKAPLVRFAIFGNAYGYLHTSSGQMRLWSSYSGAQKHLKLNFN